MAPASGAALAPEVSIGSLQKLTMCLTKNFHFRVRISVLDQGVIVRITMDFMEVFKTTGRVHARL